MKKTNKKLIPLKSKHIVKQFIFKHYREPLKKLLVLLGVSLTVRLFSNLNIPSIMSVQVIMSY